MKAGSFTVTQIMELVLSIGAVIVLIVLSIALFAPNFDKLDRGAEGYFDTLMREVAIADEDGEGEFSLQQQIGESDKDFSLIYFDDTYRFAIDGRSFLSMGGGNRLCVCYWDGEEGVCDYCESLEYPIRYDEKYEPWIVASGERVTIKKGEDNYEFSKV